MSAEEVLKEIEEIVSLFEKAKEKSERSIKEIDEQIKAEYEAKRLCDLFCDSYWEKSRKSTLETVIFQLKMALENYHSN